MYWAILILRGYGESIVSNPPNTDENKHQGVTLAK